MSSEQTNHSSTEPTKEGVVSHASIVPVADVLPPSVVLLPVSQTSIFPGMIVPVVLPEGALTNAIENVMKGSGYVGVVLAREDAAAEAASPPTTMTGLPMEPAAEERGKKKPKPKADPLEDALYWEYGVVAKVLKRINLPDNQVSILLNGVQRFRIKAIVSREPHVVANVDYLPDEVTKDTELEALLRTAVSQFKQLAKDNPLISEEVKVALVNIDGPGKLTDLMASVLVRDVDSYQDLLACNDVKERLQQLLLLLRKEQAVQNVQKQIHDEINQKVSAAQREFYLSEQLKVIQRELGHTDEKTKLVEKFEKRLKDLKPNKEVRARIDEEIEKIQNLHEQSSEYSVSLNYLDWATQIPWGVRTDENYDLGRARKILERDHFGLKDVKERVLEFLAVKKLKKSSEGSIICFVGPPGTGKTSLGKSIATALGRKFFRFSVGGMRDEAEIKGHRRTYVGAMPGKVIQGVRRVGAQNPVFMIDEVDKIGSSFSTGGDPASALLELLDPEQNKEFLDHYLDIPFDCSEILFVTTANTIDTIPPALLDRMEVIELHGYSDTEKYHIAKRHLIPRQLKKNALKASQLKFSAAGLRFLISHYARESGVRNLEKQIAKICRKVAYRIALGSKKAVTIDDAKTLERYLGNAPYAPEFGPEAHRPGVAVGLAWTQLGGEVLFIESVGSESAKGGLELTGSLGDVMKESANIAYSYIRNRHHELDLDKSFFDKNTIHLHVPSGATPKDGPSAGITMAASLYSFLSKKPIREKLAMTGELTLTGRVLPVGGIKEKLLAAKRNGIKTVLLPRANERELKSIEPEIRKGLKIHKVATMREVLRHLF